MDVRYISSCEAIWHLFLFHMQKQVPNVVCLQVHAPHEQGVIYSSNDPNPNTKKKDTTLIGWFKANVAAAEGSEILDTLYQNFPSKMVWYRDQHKWTARKDEHFACYVRKSSGPLFFTFPRGPILCPHVTVPTLPKSRVLFPLPRVATYCLVLPCIASYTILRVMSRHRPALTRRVSPTFPRLLYLPS